MNVHNTESTETDDLHEKTRSILRIMQRIEEGTTTDLTEETGYPNDVVWYHTRRLLDRGWIEHTGTIDVGAPRPANQYRITPAGRDVRVRFDDEMDATDEVDDARVEDLEQRIDQLEKTTDNMWSNGKERDEKLDQISAEIDAIKEYIEKNL